jgi:hypothetical protein
VLPTASHTHDTTTTFPRAVIAQHPALERALNATLAAIESAPELADVLAEKASQPGLVGRARALSRRAHNDIEGGLATPDPSGDVVWVSPADILARTAVRLPAPVAGALVAVSTRLQTVSSAAASAAALDQRAEGSAARRDKADGRTIAMARQQRSLPMFAHRDADTRSR